MKTCRALAIVLLIALGATGQQKTPPVDKSPMDISYCPANYPILKIQNKLTEPLVARVIYSRPQKNGRPIFGELVEYEKVWRLGANEATEVEFFRDVKFGTAKVKKGRYTLYAIPFPDKWTLILNKENDIWGAFQYDAKKDLLRMEVKTEKNTESAESFSIYFEGSKGNSLLNISWDDVIAKIPISW